jgi:hypothetical protein
MGSERGGYLRAYRVWIDAFSSFNAAPIPRERSYRVFGPLTDETLTSHPSLSSPSVKFTKPSPASRASSSCAICSLDFWFFQSPSPWPPRPRAA